MNTVKTGNAQASPNLKSRLIGVSCGRTIGVCHFIDGQPVLLKSQAILPFRRTARECVEAILPAVFALHNDPILVLEAMPRCSLPKATSHRCEAGRNAVIAYCLAQTPMIVIDMDLAKAAWFFGLKESNDNATLVEAAKRKLGGTWHEREVRAYALAAGVCA